MPRRTLVAAALLALTVGAQPPAEDPLEDGVYQLRFDGPGRPVTLTDGAPAVLGKRLSPGIGKATALKSQTNDNSRYHLTLTGLGPVLKDPTGGQAALVVDGVVIHLGTGTLGADGVTYAGANLWTAAAARTVGAKYRITPERRNHPGHRFEVRWTPDKPTFKAGEPVVLKLALKNTGTETLRFTFGGKQRGRRDNQFRFVAQEGQDGKGLPDTGDATNFGGIMSVRALRPGEAFRAEVDVTKWFTFPRPGTYRVTGILELPVLAPDDDGFGPTVWDDLAVGECDVRIR
ncbi:hypothetical protein [Urbifossiella limnaea]|uniref:Intracellular proteinase inhibitor BsuPI domain-containing protein n=1 Tax=Urbifossiella limnaea TaxID=2528023 RepID=A0A517XZ03_9BACT|nr:hypothetical protein [Urbifossiella limnaea]QDU22703.1 hypothetical protein ETAA1_46870 [Urbifossiella limnaea]